MRVNRPNEPSYAGGATFSKVPLVLDPAELSGADVAIVGAPIDELVSNRPGARYGPRAIRLADPSGGSPPPRPNMDVGVDPFEVLTVVDYGDAEVVPGDQGASHAAIRRAVGEVAAAGAIPIPWLDLLVLPAIQTQMIYHLAQFYGQPLTARRFVELASTLGLGVMMRQAAREVWKFIPYVGSVVGGVLAGASTFALGKAFCFYYSSVHQGHVPKPEDLKKYYRDQLALAERAWSSLRASSSAAAQSPAGLAPAPPAADGPAPAPPPDPGSPRTTP